MTVGSEKVLETDRGITSSHALENSLRKRLLIYRLHDDCSLYTIHEYVEF